MKDGFDIRKFYKFACNVFFMNDCIFCKIVNGEINTEFIYENDNFVSFFDVSPQVKGHALIVSKKHFKTILDIPNTLWNELADCVKKTSLRLMNDFDCEGFNVVNNTNEVAGQVVFHFHFHILPRKEEDGLNLSLKR